MSEAGASVYSASAYASGELPDLDVSIRGAVSIARRLQDPLAELVKIDPKSIGVGQYQHDVAEVGAGPVGGRRRRGLRERRRRRGEHRVGAAAGPGVRDLRRRSPRTSSRIGTPTAPSRSRRELKSVARLGPKAYEQCAGFLRIADGDDPLDTSSVHPEAYSVVRKILASTGGRVGDLIGNTAVLRALSPAAFADDTFGLPTVTDILAELEKPGRDPRPAFTTATFADGVEKIADLRVGMVLEGVVTNVAAFGAFVDVGVHQDGLVHVSAMSRKFVSDPRRGGHLRPGGQGQGDGGRRGTQADLADPAVGRRAGRSGLRAPGEGQRTGQGLRSGTGSAGTRPAARPGQAARAPSTRPDRRHGRGPPPGRPGQLTRP